MGQGMEPGAPDDAVLRRLAEDLARDDPRLAALLDGRPERSRRRRRRPRLALLAALTALITVTLLVPPTVAVGLTAMLLAIAAPLVVCWWCATDRTAPRAQ
jgi:Flp pilus assembly protein TadB